MRRWTGCAVALCGVIVGSNLCAAQTTQPAREQIDACGVLVQGVECVLFSGAGGRYVLSDYGNFRVGDAVRVTGTIDRQCLTICGEGDGCISGAVLYDPAVIPCGEPLPEFPGDICTGLSTALLAALGAGLWLSSGRGFRRT